MMYHRHEEEHPTSVLRRGNMHDVEKGIMPSWISPGDEENIISRKAGLSKMKKRLPKDVNGFFFMKSDILRRNGKQIGKKGFRNPPTECGSKSTYECCETIWSTTARYTSSEREESIWKSQNEFAFTRGNHPIQACDKTYASPFYQRPSIFSFG
jgi:hypothetical protein